jgi:hypothetical protein
MYMQRNHILLGIVFLGIINTGFPQKKAIHTMFLEEALPANGITVDFNAPVLRWPYQKGKQVHYDVELSMDPGFAAGKTIAAQGLSGAIFNPHQSLQTGKWYWHYRVSGKSWSAVKYFMVSDASLPMVSPEPSVFLSHVPQAHPRVLVDNPATYIHSLSGKKEAVVIIADAEKALTEKIPVEMDIDPVLQGKNEQQQKKLESDAVVAFGNHVNQLIQSLCEAYLLTGDQKYIPKAIAIGMEAASWDAKGITGSRDFTDGICMYDMALVYDTFYEQLTGEQKNILRKAIKERAGKFYKSWVNNIESKVLSGHVWQLILNEFFKTSLALYGDEPEAAQWLSYAYDLFLNRSPVLGGIDGAWGEGASYFQMNMEVLTEIPDKIKTYTGFDFIKQHPWYQNNADWLIYQFPPGSSADGYGDNTEELFEPTASYAAYAEVMAKLTQNPKYSWYYKQLQKYRQYDLSQETKMRWFRLVNTDKLSMPPAPENLLLPMGHLFKETGVASLHTHPANTSKDLMVTMRSSPYGAYGHILADQNTFNILVAGKRLFYRTGYKVAMDDPHRLGWSKHTKGQNGVLINGEGEPYTAEAYGNFSRFLQGGELAYMKGDASNAYQSKESKEDYGVNKFYRHMVLLKPNIIVIYDELESAEDASWSWLIHSLEHMKLDSLHNTFTASIANAKGIGKLWSSEPFRWQISDKFDVPAVIFRNYKGMRTKKYDDTQWHLKAINKDKTSKLRFLSVIQVSTDGKILNFKELPAEKGMTKLTIGGWEIEAALSYNLAPQLNIRSLSGSTVFAAYGSSLNIKNQSYKAGETGNAMLAEMVNGKITFSETADVPVRPLR